MPDQKQFDFRERLPFISESAHKRIEARLWEIDSRWRAYDYRRPGAIGLSRRDIARIHSDAYRAIAEEVNGEVPLTLEMVTELLPLLAAEAVIDGDWGTIVNPRATTVPTEQNRCRLGKYYLNPVHLDRVTNASAAAVSKWRRNILLRESGPSKPDIEDECGSRTDQQESERRILLPTPPPATLPPQVWAQIENSFASAERRYLEARAKLELAPSSRAEIVEIEALLLACINEQICGYVSELMTAYVDPTVLRANVDFKLVILINTAFDRFHPEALTRERLDAKARFQSAVLTWIRAHDLG